MLRIRRIDHGIQCLLGLIMVLALPVLFLYGFLAGLFLMGGWQLLSAFFNTNSFLSSGLGSQICTYWKCSGLVFALLFLCVPLAEIAGPDDVQVVGAVAVSASIPVAVYYLVIYKKLIGHFALREELRGLIKSKH